MFKTIACSALVLIATATTALAANCTLALRDNWSASLGHMMEFNRQVMQAKNMSQPYDDETLCRATHQMPELLQLAQEYFPACDPMEGPRVIAYIKDLANKSARFQQLKCAASDKGQARKAKR